MKVIFTAVKISKVLDEAMWSDKVPVKWHPPKGFFKKSASDIASGLKSASKSLGQAMARLNFYINRSGSNLSSDRKSTLGNAKKILSNLYGK
jgi:hypothetical protein